MLWPLEKVTRDEAYGLGREVGVERETGPSRSTATSFPS